MFPRKHIVWCMLMITAVQISISHATQFVRWPLYAQNKAGEAITEYWMGDARSMLSCFAMCNQFVKCHTAAFSGEDRICHLYDTDPDDYDDQSLPVTMPFLIHFKKVGKLNTDDGPCKNGAIQHNETFCECVGGFVGKFCDTIMQDCSEGFDSGFYDGVDGVFDIQPTITDTPFQVRCIMENGGYTVIQTNTINDIINFNRTWQEYVDGFGELAGSHWLGLDKMHYITYGRIQYALFFVKAVANADYLVRRYLGFTVDALYTMNYDISFTEPGFGDLGDSLTSSKGQPFTTYDSDNDKSTAHNCAVQYGAGFWYKNCSNCNPNGIIDGITIPSDVKRIHWRNHLGLEIITDFEIRLTKF